MLEDQNEGSTLGASISEASRNLWIRPWEVSRLLGEPHPKPLLATSCSYDCPLLRGINKESSESWNLKPAPCQVPLSATVATRLLELGDRGPRLFFCGSHGQG